jgi:hypothetical protein
MLEQLALWLVRTGLAGSLILVLCGCSLSGGPKMRLGCLPTDTFGISFPDANSIGTHSYGFGGSESGGIIYTCRGGDIDIDHVRGVGDLTRYLTERTREALLADRKEFSCRLVGERSVHTFTFTYPVDWKTRSDREKVAREVSLGAGSCMAWNAYIWHEIMTWFGTHFAGFEPEFNSAFSWEDVYSDLIGTRAAVAAMRDTQHSYDEAVTIAIRRELDMLGVRSADVARAASSSVRGKWYTGNLVPDMKMRNFDIGLDGYVTPVLIPNVPGCGSEPLKLPAPSLAILRKYGFAMTHQIEQNIFEAGAIRRAAGAKGPIMPERDFPTIMKVIEQQAAARGDEFMD